MTSIATPDLHARNVRDLLGLMMVPGMGQVLIGRCLETFASAAEVARQSPTSLAQVRGISLSLARKALDTLDRAEHWRSVDEELELCHRHQVRLICRGAPDYPRLLHYIPDAPWMLQVRGTLEASDALALGIVGARRCTAYGREQAGRMAFQAAQAGLVVVSGGAYGIDAAAHEAALKARGRTLAVLGCGLGQLYPREHEPLYARIAEQGALISELRYNTPPMAEHFPRRNRIISGLSLGILVIEAAVRSGAMITARLCVEEHGRELMALPGRVDSAASEGCHKMIREGWAKLVTGMADVMDCLGEAGASLKAQMQSPEAGGETETQTQTPVALDERDPVRRRILEGLGQPATLDELLLRTALPAAQLQAALTMLELTGAVRRQGGLFSRRGA